ncbi:Peptidase family A1 domain [Arabidopsis thaliana x Arabidopsis arenosa]|uniref:Peptidase family A1 domain n=1 Tax=Arabidopsis thaliana x Arabidopsis arenosa TaxID=1240361 RepID=A0A8T1ZKB5_9BRAS|nr:Peptidase family A1 domain [Arabidopsis thaliana x Arabidopsis arenosa]
MASSQIIFSILLLFIFSLSSSAKPSSRPKALILPVTKDQSTLQYTTIINQRTPLVPASVVFDLGGRELWVDCDKGYVSTTYHSPRCNSAVCSRAGSISCGTCFSPPKPGCSNNTCGAFPSNTVTGWSTSGEFALDVVSIQSTNGSNPGRFIKIPNIIFSCGSTSLLKGLAKGTVGMAGMGRHKISLPSQFAATFSFNRKFAVCLTSGKGVAFFGNVPYVFLPGIEISRLQTTPLLVNPGVYSQTEYFIGVTAIKIVEKTVPINQTLLKINKSTGFGGTKISSVNPYTVLESSIFKSFTSMFVRQATARNMTRVTSVKPFSACFSTQNVGVTRLGYAVPEIQLVLHSNDVVWRIFGGNSMVSVSDEVICLGFVDGGVNARTSVVIGGFQLEDNLIEFDLASNRFGFSSTLLGRRTNCANFNFTSIA